MMDYAFMRGTGVALVTPFNDDNSVDFESLTNLVEYVIKGGVEYLVVMGTTGESVVLNDDEKQQVLKHIISVNRDRLPIALGIGGNNTSQVYESLRKQDFTGVSALLSVCPYYNKPNQKGLYAHFEQIARVCPIPIILYNVPGRTGSWLSPDTTIELARNFKNIVATKEASGQFEGIMKIVADKPDDFIIVSGDDSITLPLISIGVEGVISVVGNAAPKKMSEMVRSALQGDYSKARSLHYSLLPLIDLIFQEGNPAGVKAGLNSIGILKNNIRLPLTPVSDKLYKDIQESMKEVS
jgi:4-hydroxy-tetrahydrodipicolinate synthase